MLELGMEGGGWEVKSGLLPSWRQSGAQTDRQAKEGRKGAAEVE